jgi:septal ring factor EnvC (AmiA/AmiB activator)
MKPWSGDVARVGGTPLILLLLHRLAKETRPASEAWAKPFAGKQQHLPKAYSKKRKNPTACKRPGKTGESSGGVHSMNRQKLIWPVSVIVRGAP